MKYFAFILVWNVAMGASAFACGGHSNGPSNTLDQGFQGGDGTCVFDLPYVYNQNGDAFAISSVNGDVGAQGFCNLQGMRFLSADSSQVQDVRATAELSSFGDFVIIFQKTSSPVARDEYGQIRCLQGSENSGSQQPPPQGPNPGFEGGGAPLDPPICCPPPNPYGIPTPGAPLCQNC